MLRLEIQVTYYRKYLICNLVIRVVIKRTFDPKSPDSELFEVFLLTEQHIKKKMKRQNFEGY